MQTATPAMDLAPRQKTTWPAWKITLAYIAMSAVALGSIWSIDGHVMQIAREQSAKAAVAK